MNLVDELLKCDSKKADERQTKVLKSKRLATILGVDEPVDITIKELPQKRLDEIIALQIDRKGGIDTSKMHDVKLLTVVESVVDPELRNADLLEHFGCATPKDLAEKLFGSEINKISAEVIAMGGLNNEEEDEEEIKN